MRVDFTHRHHALLLTSLLVLVTAVPSGCRGPEERERDRWEDLQRGQFEQRSETLAAAFDEILDAHLTRQEPADDEAEREELRERLLDTVPGLLLTTERMERAFADGEFPNAENQRRVDRLLDRLRMFDAHLPALTQMLVHEHRRGELRDARLEILRRLLEHHEEGIGERLWPS